MNALGKSLWSAAVAGLLLLGAGCSGINASHSVSPASFFLPGLLYAPPAQAQPGIPSTDSEPSVVLARVP